MFLMIGTSIPELPHKVQTALENMEFAVAVKEVSN